MIKVNKEVDKELDMDYRIGKLNVIHKTLELLDLLGLE